MVLDKVIGRVQRACGGCGSTWQAVHYYDTTRRHDHHHTMALSTHAIELDPRQRCLFGYRLGTTLADSKKRGRAVLTLRFTQVE